MNYPHVFILVFMKEKGGTGGGEHVFLQFLQERDKRLTVSEYWKNALSEHSEPWRRIETFLTDAGEDDHLPVLLDVGLDLDIVELLLEVEDDGVVGGEIRRGRRDGFVRRRRWKLHALCRHRVKADGLCCNETRR